MGLVELFLQKGLYGLFGCIIPIGLSITCIKYLMNTTIDRPAVPLIYIHHSKYEAIDTHELYKPIATTPTIMLIVSLAILFSRFVTIIIYSLMMVMRLLN
jgi:hypothetical protein